MKMMWCRLSDHFLLEWMKLPKSLKLRNIRLSYDRPGELVLVLDGDALPDDFIVKQGEEIQEGIILHKIIVQDDGTTATVLDRVERLEVPWQSPRRAL